MAFVRVNGAVIHYELAGNPSLQTLVFSNSLGTDFRIWDAVVAELGDGFRVLRYDSRGHGLSEAPPPPYAIGDHTDDLAALMDHLGIARACVIGLSVGGVIAQALAATRPDLVARLVLSNTAHRIGTETMWNERIGAVTQRGIGAIADGVLQRWFTAAYRSPDNPDFVGYAAMLTRTPADGYAGTCAVLRDTDLTNSTRALKVPTLVIAGDQDGSTPPDLVRSTADLIDGSDYHLIRDAAHLPCIEKPRDVARLIGGFLTRTEFR